MDDASDAALVLRAVGGDQAAYGALVHRHTPLVYGIALAHLGEQSDAEDICQDVFLKAYTVLATCRAPDRFAAWVARIARRRSINARIARRLRRVLPLREALQVARAERDPAAAADLRRALAAALARLTSVRREVVILHDLQGFSHAEIAVCLSCSELMSRRHLSDARKQLRGWLAAHRLEEWQS